MRVRSFRLCVVLAAMGLALGACATVESPQEGAVVTGQPAAVVTTTPAVAVTIPTELATIHPAYVTAWQGTDPHALRVYFADNAVVTTPAGEFTGWHDIHMKWLMPTLPNMSGFTAVPTAFTREGDVIVETGNLKYVLKRDGQPSDVSAVYTYRWQKQADGSYKLLSVQIK